MGLEPVNMVGIHSMHSCNKQPSVRVCDTRVTTMLVTSYDFFVFENYFSGVSGDFPQRKVQVREFQSTSNVA